MHDIYDMSPLELCLKFINHLCYNIIHNYSNKGVFTHQDRHSVSVICMKLIDNLYLHLLFKYYIELKIHPGLWTPEG
jgi:hypothetical protein